MYLILELHLFCDEESTFIKINVVLMLNLYIYKYTEALAISVWQRRAAGRELRDDIKHSSCLCKPQRTQTQ